MTFCCWFWAESRYNDNNSLLFPQQMPMLLSYVKHFKPWKWPNHLMKWGGKQLGLLGFFFIYNRNILLNQAILYIFCANLESFCLDFIFFIWIILTDNKVKVNFLFMVSCKSITQFFQCKHQITFEDTRKK